MTRILVVDDNKQNRYILDVLFKSHGYEVISAVNGADALERALEQPPDLIVTDILMPVMDGFALCRQWKADQKLKHIPFIFYTATYTEPDDEKFALSLGADRYIVKPADLAVLMQVVNEVLEEARARLPTSSRIPAPEEEEFLKDYSKVLFQKLEQKVEKLESEILERREAEAALRESEERYRTLITQSPDGIFLADLKGAFLSVNQRMCDTLGYSEDELLKMSIWDIVPEEYMETHKARLAGILRGGRIDGVAQYEVRTKGGEALLVEVSSAPHRKGGEIVGFHGIARDITERKQSAQALAASKKMLEEIINALPVRVFWKDKDLVYLGCNMAFARDAGFAQPKDLVGKDDYQMGWRDQAELYRGDDLRIIESGLPRLLIEETQTTPEGDTLTLLTSKLPLRGPEGEITGLLGTYMDITERKRVEEELRRAEERLVQSKNLETIGMIAGGVAHEVRNPLFAISTIVAALEIKLQNLPEFGEYVMHIKDQTTRLNQLMNDLLILGRPVEDSAFLPCALRDLLDETHRQLSAGSASPHLCLIEAPKEPLVVMGSAEKLVQVFLNVTSNAVAFSPDGQPIRIRLWREGDQACVAVSDSGSGIPEAMLPKIFRPFASRRKGGTGLGLAIVQRIVEAHGGIVEAKNNNPEPGATFTVRLPMANPSKNF